MIKFFRRQYILEILFSYYLMKKVIKSQRINLRFLSKIMFLNADFFKKLPLKGGGWGVFGPTPKKKILYSYSKKTLKKFYVDLTIQELLMNFFLEFILFIIQKICSLF